MKKVLKVFLFLICVMPLVAVFSACGKTEESEKVDYVIRASGVSLEYKKIEYDGFEKEPAVTVTVGGQTLKSDEFSVSYSNNIEIGTALVEVKAAEGGKYTGSATVSFEITKIKLASEDVTLEYEHVMFSGEENTPTVRIVHNNMVIPSELYQLTYQNNINAGTATVLISGIGNENYDINVSKTFEIVPMIYNADTWEFDIEYESIEYDGEAKTPGVTVKVKGVLLEEGKDYTVTYYRNTNIGTASVYIESLSGSNYSFSQLINFEITGEIDLPELEFPESQEDVGEQAESGGEPSGESERQDETNED